MTAVPVPSRGYGSLSQLPPSIRSPQPMPAPLSRVALAARQNQIMALQALQAAAASASASGSSSSSSAGGSPPPSSSYAKSSNGSVYAASAKRGRKFQAFRAPSLANASLEAASTLQTSQKSAATLVPLITTSVPHWSAEGSHPLFDPNSGKRSEIYSLTNDRYPGAPGTALAKAREAQQKAIQSAKREAAKKLASKAELEHLGVKGLGKKRKSSSPYATVAGAVHAAAVVHAASSSSRTGQDSQAMSRDSSRGRNSAKTSAEANLTVPSASRSRRPPSRASSPAPITTQTSSGRRSGTRSGSAAPAEDDSSSSGANTGRNNRNSPSRGTSPPESSKNHHGLASTAPFQSSPLAASAITMEPMLDTDEADPNDAKPTASDLDPSPSAARAAASKRKASALSQEVRVDEAEAAVSESLDEVSKRLKRDTDEAGKDVTGEEAVERAVKEGSPSSISSSRRTSPRMSSRRIVAEAA
ncbi:uncharacterized protein UTRI_00158_B [Ustilago trichophora]|uniref:Uncharacterized protein n=1 Tax=Ustilago trichophora TaxID=86804 RepID=A0A5C3DRB7_9BASI|nr:uncharacterized protein UTRI_00158_B [Ustilago trichophora]